MSDDRAAAAAPGWAPATGKADASAVLEPDRLGLRVTVRRRLPPGAAAAATDVVGTLVAADRGHCVVRDRHGADTIIARGDVTAARVVPDPARRLRRAADVDPAVLERVATLGWQPTETARLGGWTMRAAHGFTGRANSVLPLGDPGLPLDDALTHVVAWYAERGLRARLQVPLPWAADLDVELARRGWEPITPVHVMVADVAGALAALDAVAATAGSAPARVTVASRPDDDWLVTYRYGGEPLPPQGLEVLLRADEPLFVVARDDVGPVAVGRGALAEGWLGITAVDVVVRARRRGHGRAVLRTLLEQASAAGVRHAYLQVADDNAPALTLYASSGFTVHHDYVYRLAPTGWP